MKIYLYIINILLFFLLTGCVSVTSVQAQPDLNVPTADEIRNIKASETNGYEQVTKSIAQTNTTSSNVVSELNASDIKETLPNNYDTSIIKYGKFKDVTYAKNALCIQFVVNTTPDVKNKIINEINAIEIGQDSTLNTIYIQIPDPISYNDVSIPIKSLVYSELISYCKFLKNTYSDINFVNTITTDTNK